jgi:hypothetical protein
VFPLKSLFHRTRINKLSGAFAGRWTTASSREPADYINRMKLTHNVEVVCIHPFFVLSQLSYWKYLSEIWCWRWKMKVVGKILILSVSVLYLKLRSKCMAFLQRWRMCRHYTAVTVGGIFLLRMSQSSRVFRSFVQIVFVAEIWGRTVWPVLRDAGHEDDETGDTESDPWTSGLDTVRSLPLSRRNFLFLSIRYCSVYQGVWYF